MPPGLPSVRGNWLSAPFIKVHSAFSGRNPTQTCTRQKRNLLAFIAKLQSRALVLVPCAGTSHEKIDVGAGEAEEMRNLSSAGWAPAGSCCDVITVGCKCMHSPGCLGSVLAITCSFSCSCCCESGDQDASPGLAGFPSRTERTAWLACLCGAEQGRERRQWRGSQKWPHCGYRMGQENWSE